MDPSTISTSTTSVMLVMMLIIILTTTQQNNRRMLINKYISKKKNGDRKIMKELAQRYINKKCLLYMFNGNQYVGFIKEVADGAMTIENKGNLETINLDFVMRIKEVPKNKDGKYKSTFG